MRLVDAEQPFNDRAKLVVLFFQRFIFDAAEADFASPILYAGLAKTFSFAQARLSARSSRLRTDITCEMGQSPVKLASLSCPSMMPLRPRRHSAALIRR